MTDVALRRLTGDGLEAALDDLARLRIAVFRDWPYLYDGDFDYERDYLATYTGSDKAVIIGAYDGERLIGAATAAPLADHFAAFSAPFLKAGLTPERFFYFGESVLLKPYRGRGIGVRFFKAREAAARAAGFDRIVFCGVVRPEDHPARPDDYVPLDAFWRNRGYRPMDGIVCEFPWRDIGDTEQTNKTMQFWIKALDGGAASGGS